MSHIDFKAKRIDRYKARKLIAEIVNNCSENIVFSKHANEELIKDGLTQLDVWNILKSPHSRIVSEGDLERGSYRYRLETQFIMLVISFWPLGDGLVIVTAWDKRKKGWH
jgi:hypothetical protein